MPDSMVCGSVCAKTLTLTLTLNLSLTLTLTPSSFQGLSQCYAKTLTLTLTLTPTRRCVAVFAPRSPKSGASSVSGSRSAVGAPHAHDVGEG